MGQAVQHVSSGDYFRKSLLYIHNIIISGSLTCMPSILIILIRHKILLYLIFIISEHGTFSFIGLLDIQFKAYSLLAYIILYPENLHYIVRQIPTSFVCQMSVPERPFCPYYYLSLHSPKILAGNYYGLCVSVHKLLLNPSQC